MTTATVRLWGTAIGYVSMDAGERFARFEFDPEFARSGIELAPLVMPVEAGRIYVFPELEPRSFHGLPGLLSDSLPDKYGNRLIDVWLARTGRRAEDFNAVERLCCIGTRGMSALEFEPSSAPDEAGDRPLELAQLVELAALAFAEKDRLDAKLDGSQGDRGLLDILTVGTSAGGARAKAVIAFDPRTKAVRSGQTRLPPGFEHWLIKFDGVRRSGDWGVADPAGFGLLEYSYAKIAALCGIEMAECRLLEENGRSHFMTRRFDRDAKGGKRFLQTFAALRHFDYYETGAYSYEQLFETARRLGLGPPALEQLFRRTVFNLVGCNQDDHVKNHAFLMDRRGRWSLSPAYDLCHAEGSAFTRTHQLSLNQKTSSFTFLDLHTLARFADLPQGRARRILDQTLAAFATWPRLAQDLHIPPRLIDHVTGTLRLAW
jgi:serine/threonine-protein kinase HipA